MYEKAAIIKKRYDELSLEVVRPEVISSQELWQKKVKEMSELEDVANKYDEYTKLSNTISENRTLAEENTDPEFADMLEAEMFELEERFARCSEELKVLLLPRDPNDGRNVVVEIRAGAGGDEASLFGTVLMRMYYRFSERMRWKIEEINMNMTDLGGVKEVVFMISGKNVYSNMKYESGVHRVQRVPTTESQGRVHTSTATVAVLPEAEDVDVAINQNDLKIDTYRAGGAGGQYVNKTESAIRITHLPTGIVVTCQDEKSQTKNKDKAMKVLKSRLYDHYRSLADKEYSDYRKSQVGTGDRSERIRTYNYPQGRVTDHRIGKTLYSLLDFLDGDMTEMIQSLHQASQEALLKGSEE